MPQKIILTVLSCFLFVTVWSQQDPVLFTVDDTPVTASEFNYIYSKTNGKKADFSKASLQEYLDLYVKFKLKVQRARDLKLDTIPSLKRELAGYRKQLSSNYLIDKEVTEKLVKETYDRLEQDIKVSHIFVAKPKEKGKQQAALSKINGLRKELDQGANFDKLAMEKSEDPGAKTNKGSLGFLTALQYPGFYDLESAAYNTPIGKYSEVVESPIGYHIVMPKEKRDARGKIEGSHILVRIKKDGSNQEAAKTKIDDIYSKLKKGGKFANLARTFSEDKNTAGKGGKLGTFGIGKYEEVFENAIFSLKKDGEYTEPVRSSLGYHIIQRNKRTPLPAFAEYKARLTGLVKRDARYNLARESMVTRIKKESGFKENTATFSKFTSSLDKTFATRGWKAPKEGLDAPLFSIGKESRTLGDFVKHLSKSPNRFRRGKVSPESVAKELYNNYVSKATIEYEESQLENKYPEFKALMREYSEGILLFEATKRLVWDKASQDTVGLKAFHATRGSEYKWQERADIDMVTINTTDKALAEKIYKYAGKKSIAKTMGKFNKKDKTILVENSTFEKGKNKDLEKVDWKGGARSALFEKDGKMAFIQVNKIIPPMNKTLKEAKGYVVADYQEKLEKDWITELKKDYKVNIDQKVFNSLIK